MFITSLGDKRNDFILKEIAIYRNSHILTFLIKPPCSVFKYSQYLNLHCFAIDIRLLRSSDEPENTYYEY